MHTCAYPLHTYLPITREGEVRARIPGDVCNCRGRAEDFCPLHTCFPTASEAAQADRKWPEIERAGAAVADPAHWARCNPGLIAGCPSPQEAAEARTGVTTTVWVAVGRRAAEGATAAPRRAYRQVARVGSRGVVDTLGRWRRRHFIVSCQLPTGAPQCSRTFGTVSTVLDAGQFQPEREEVPQQRVALNARRSKGYSKRQCCTAPVRSSERRSSPRARMCGMRTLWQMQPQLRRDPDLI